jgi:hypothetical protein
MMGIMRAEWGYEATLVDENTQLRYLRGKHEKHVM